MTSLTVRAIREALGMTISQFAKSIGIDRQELVLLETEDLPVPASIAGAILMTVWFQPIDSLHPRRWIFAH